MTKKILNKITYEIIGAAIEVHKELGPGLLEKVYEDCMIHELSLRGIKVVRQKAIPVFYKEKVIEVELRFDLLVEDCIVVELKAVSKLTPIFDAQIISYTRLLKIPKGILINFNCRNIFSQGQKTFVNEYFKDLPEG